MYHGHLSHGREGAEVMFVLLQVISVSFSALALALAAARALELPGRIRLDHPNYVAAQSASHPGFTHGGLLGEIGGLCAMLLLLLVMPLGSSMFVWTLLAFAALAAMHAVYWSITYPLNQFWLRDMKLTFAPTGFFATHPLPRPPIEETSWPRLRARWEYSHLVRALLGAISLVALVTGLLVE